MNCRRIAAAVTLALLATIATADEALPDALAALRASGPKDRDEAAKAVLALSPTLDGIAEALDAGLPPPAATEGWSVREAVDSEGVGRPYHLYIPKSVAATGDPAPLLVDMHGGVSRPVFIDEQRFSQFRTAWVPVAEEAGVVVALPLGRADCVWWKVAGVRHVVEIPSGIVVVADNTWSALQGASKLDVTWEGDFDLSSADISAHFAEVAEGEGVEARSEGDIGAGMEAVATKLDYPGISIDTQADIDKARAWIAR